MLNFWTPKGGAPKGWRPKPGKSGARKVGAPKGGGHEGWSPEAWSPERWGAQNFALFFFPPPATIFFLLSLSWGSFRGILVVFVVPGPCFVHVWRSWAFVCDPRRPGLVGPPGFTQQPENSKRAHFRVPVLQRTTKIPREDPQREREQKSENGSGRGKKKSEILGGPAEGCPAEVSEMGCRVQGFGFSSGLWGRKQKQNRNKMKRDE